MRSRSSSARSSRARQPAGRGVGDEESAGDDAPELPAVVKVKRFAIEPMFEEDAVSQMEELGHSFFVFVNAENERLAVLYRRRDGHYGMIEPQIGGLYTRTVKRKASPAPDADGKRRQRGS